MALGREFGGAWDLRAGSHVRRARRAQDDQHQTRLPRSNADTAMRQKRAGQVKVVDGRLTRRRWQGIHRQLAGWVVVAGLGGGGQGLTETAHEG